MAFDPNAAATHSENIFGLPTTREDASIVLIPCPYDATSSYGVGSAHAPEAIREASAQVDLFDRRFGAIYERGIFMEPHPPQVHEWSKQARALAEPIIEQGGSKAGDEDAVTQVDGFSRRAASFVHDRAIAAMKDGKVPGLIGGEHGVAFGLYKAVADRHPGVGILQIDAHMDLRPAFEGFAWSHASVMHNAVYDLDGVSRIVQVGIRDYCEQEASLAESLAPENQKDGSPEGETQIITYFWDDLADERNNAIPWGVACERIINKLPSEIIISVDIDGLDPTLCPHTGTPVPGGLSWDQFSLLLKMIKESERTVVGFDLVEVCPSKVPGAAPIDASIGARVLYRLCGCV